MNDLPRQKLREIIVQYGRSLCEEPRRCEGLLRDFCGEYKAEINVLVSALEEQVAADLLASQDNVPQELLLARLTKRLQDNRALTKEAARWAVESWALALGVIEPEQAIGVSKPPNDRRLREERVTAPEPEQPSRWNLRDELREEEEETGGA